MEYGLREQQSANYSAHGHERPKTDRPFVSIENLRPLKLMRPISPTHMVEPSMITASIQLNVLPGVIHP